MLAGYDNCSNKPGSPHDEHQCYKNWTESSSAKGTSAILEGFQEAEKSARWSDKLNLSVMAIVQSIRPLYRKFLGGGQSKRLNVLIMRVNVTVQGWKSLFKVILVTRARVA